MSPASLKVPAWETQAVKRMHCYSHVGVQGPNFDKCQFRKPRWTNLSFPLFRAFHLPDSVEPSSALPNPSLLIPTTQSPLYKYSWVQFTLASSPYHSSVWLIKICPCPFNYCPALSQHFIQLQGPIVSGGHSTHPTSTPSSAQLRSWVWASSCIPQGSPSLLSSPCSAPSSRLRLYRLFIPSQTGWDALLPKQPASHHGCTPLCTTQIAT